jgi:hypothetical protein
LGNISQSHSPALEPYRAQDVFTPWIPGAIFIIKILNIQAYCRNLIPVHFSDSEPPSSSIIQVILSMMFCDPGRRAVDPASLAPGLAAPRLPD